MKRWQKRPDGSNWGDFGPDDRLGRMNLVTPARRRAGAAEIREGLAFCLSLPLNYPGYTGEKRGPRKPPRLMALTDDNKSWYHTMLGPQGCCPQESICDDGVLLSLQYSTQWDSFAHYGRLFDANDDGEAEKVYYNGYTAKDDFLGADQEGGPYALSLGIENMAETGVQGRGVMLDLCAAYGKDRRWIGYDDFMRAMEAQNVTVDPGDFLLIHTGYGAAIMAMGNAADPAALDRTGAVLDASDERLLRWVSESGVAALCSDNVAVEGVDFSGPRHKSGLLLPLHDLCLFKLGIHLGELWYLSELATWLRAHQRNAFLLTAPPLRLPGAVGSPATPVATV
jgi:kynurenine formamidase